MLNWIKQPYPLNLTTLLKCRSVFLNGFLVSGFLWLFRPFDINNTPVSNLDGYILGFGPITMAITAIGVFIIPGLMKDYFREENWTVGKHILYSLVLVFFIGLANLYYSHFVSGLAISFRSLLEYQFYTLAVTLFLITTGTFLNHHLSLRKFEKGANNLNKRISTQNTSCQTEKSIRYFTLLSDNKKEELVISTETLLFVESADNYCKIHTINGSKVEFVLLRTSLKRLEEQLNDPVFFRCHRSYLVNLEMVKSVSGNSQGYRLVLKSAESIPVSRSFRQALTEKLTKPDLVADKMRMTL